jgi:hypothetical protein
VRSGSRPGTGARAIHWSGGVSQSGKRVGAFAFRCSPLAGVRGSEFGVRGSQIRAPQSEIRNSVYRSPFTCADLRRNESPLARKNHALEEATRLLRARARIYSSRPPFPKLRSSAAFAWGFLLASAIPRDRAFRAEWKPGRKSHIIQRCLFNPS